MASVVPICDTIVASYTDNGLGQATSEVLYVYIHVYIDFLQYGSFSNDAGAQVLNLEFGL